MIRFKTNLKPMPLINHNKYRLIFIPFSAIILLFCFVSIGWYLGDNDPNSLSLKLILVGRIGVLIILMIFLANFFIKNIIKNQLITDKLKNGLTTVYTLSFLFLLLELTLTFNTTTTNSSQFSFSQLNWYLMYADNGKNFPFRNDYQNTLDEPRVVFIGDSFTYGTGINDVSQRFSNIFSQQTEINCWNMGIPGYNTYFESKLIDELQVRPDIIVLQYFLNDILKEANTPLIKSVKQKITEQYTAKEVKRSRWLQWLYMNSYNINYLLNNFGPRNGDYKVYLDKLFDSEPIFQDHVNDIITIKKVCDQKGIEVVVLLFPEVTELDWSENKINKIAHVLVDLQIKYIRIGPMISQIPDRKRIVNNGDHHVSILVNQLIGDSLVGFIEANNELF